MRRSTLVGVLGFTLAASAAEGTALAQTKAEPDGYVYNFTDDYMMGDTISTHTAIIEVRKRAARVTLIRPRASFVPEMFKSVEAL